MKLHDVQLADELKKNGAIVFTQEWVFEWVKSKVGLTKFERGNNVVSIKKAYRETVAVYHFFVEGTFFVHRRRPAINEEWLIEIGPEHIQSFEDCKAIHEGVPTFKEREARAIRREYYLSNFRERRLLNLCKSKMID